MFRLVFVFIVAATFYHGIAHAKTSRLKTRTARQSQKILASETPKPMVSLSPVASPPPFDTNCRTGDVPPYEVDEPIHK